MRDYARMDTAARTPETIEIEDGGRIDRWIDLSAACEITALAAATLRNAERRGEIPGYRLLGRLRFRVSDLMEWIEAGRSAPRRTPPPELITAARRRRRRR